MKLFVAFIFAIALFQTAYGFGDKEMEMSPAVKNDLDLDYDLNFKLNPKPEKKCHPLLGGCKYNSEICASTTK